MRSLGCSPLLTGLLSLACIAILVITFFPPGQDRDEGSNDDAPNPLSGSKVADPSHVTGHWVDTWATAPQSAKVEESLPSSMYDSGRYFVNTTIRQTLRLTIGAEQLRFRFSNVFGLDDLAITKVTIAVPKPGYGPWNGTRITGSQEINTNTLQILTFGGDEYVTIPNRGLAVSDPIKMSARTGQEISVSIYLQRGQAGRYVTNHRVSRTTSWFVNGDHSEQQTFPLKGVERRAHWYFVSAVEAWKPRTYSTFVVMGDSISDGRDSVMNTHGNWPNFLFERMQADGDPDIRHISIVNQAAGGNQLLRDGYGPNAISRLDRDVLTHSGVKYAMIFEGVNDIGHTRPVPDKQAQLADRMIQFYKQSITRIHAFGIPVFGATITPFGCRHPLLNAYSSPVREETRLKINEWIRTSGWFDAVVDFDHVVRDPSNHTQLEPRYDSGDCLHPNSAAYKQMAATFPVELFQKFKDGVDGFM